MNADDFTISADSIAKLDMVQGVMSIMEKEMPCVGMRMTKIILYGRSLDLIAMWHPSDGHREQYYVYVSCVIRKPAFCICENKDADQLRGNREADQRLCFRYTDSIIPLLLKSEISNL